MKSALPERMLLLTTVLLSSLLGHESSAISFQSDWLQPIDGSWTDASNWSTSPVFPDNDTPANGDTYDVHITQTGAPYTVSLFESVTISDLTIDSSDATLALGNSRLETPTIHLESGTFLLGTGTPGFSATEAEIVGATITGPGTLQIPFNGATPVLNNVTLGVDLAVPSSGGSPPKAKLLLRNSLHLQDGTTLVVQGRGGLVQVEGSQSFTGAGRIVFDDPSTSFETGTLRFSEDTLVTIDPEFSIRATTMSGSVGAIRGSGFSSRNIGLVNHGLLSGEAAGQPLYLMNVSTANGATFQNHNIVQAIGDGVVIVGSDWTNDGTFNIRDNGSLYLAGDFSVEDIGAIDRQGGKLYIAGRVHNAGKTIVASAETGDIILGRENFFFPGPTQILGGAIDATDGASWIFRGGELVDVTMATNASIERVDVFGDLTIDDVSLSVGRLRFRDDPVQPQMLAGKGILRFDLGGGGSISIPNNGSLSIDPDIVIESSGGDGELQGGMLINHGALLSGPGDDLDVEVFDFTNRGVLEISGRTTIGRGDDSSWRNEGTIRIKPGGALTMSGTFTTDDMGTLIDEGADRVWLTGVLDNTGRTLDLEDLNLTVPLTLHGGEIRGGRLESSGDATLDFTSIQFAGFFDGVTLATDLTIPGGAGGAGVHIRNGLTLENSTITMPEGAGLSFQGDVQTLGGQGVIFAPNRPLTSSITTIAGSELVIGEDITIRNGLEAFRELQIDFKENRGTIIVEAPSSLVSIGDNINLGTGPLWTNNGVIQVLDGTLEFHGNYSVDNIGTLERSGGEVVLHGNILNEGKTILLNQTTGSWQIRGTVHGGRIETTDGVVAVLGGTLDLVTLAGEATGGFSLDNKLILDDAVLKVPEGEQINIRSGPPIEIIGSGVIELNGTPANTIIQTFTGSDLTIGPGVTVRTGATGGGIISRSTLPVTNHGVISAETNGQILAVDGDLENFGILRSTRFGTLRVDSDAWVNQGTIEVGPRRNSGGFLITSDSFENGEQGVITGQGILTLTNTTLVNAGTIAPGITVGKMDVEGDVRMTTTSILSAEVGGVAAGESDLLKVLGNVQLDGLLDLHLVDGRDLELFVPFPIIVTHGGGEISGRFSNATNDVQLGAALFTVDYQPNEVTLTLIRVPEPATLPLILFLAILLLGCKSRGELGGARHSAA